MTLKEYVEDKGWDRSLLFFFSLTFFFTPVATSPAVIAGIVSVVLWIVSGRCIVDREKWMRQSWTKPVLLFMLLPIAGLAWTDDLSLGLSIARKGYYWFYAFAILSVTYRDRYRLFMQAYLAGLTASAIVSLLQYMTIIPLKNINFPAALMGHIEYSLLLVYGMLLLSFFYKNTVSRTRIFIVLLMTIYIGSLVVNIGRIGYLAFVLLSPWMLHTMFGKKHYFKTAAAVIALVILLALSTTVQDRTKLAIDELQGYFQEGNKVTSVGMRPYMWQGAVKIFLAHPVLGVGTGGYRSAMRQYKDDPELMDYGHPHNSILYMAASFGLVGIFSFFWLITVYFRKTWTIRHTLQGFAALSYGVVLMIGSLTDTQINVVSTGMFFALHTGFISDDTE